MAAAARPPAAARPAAGPAVGKGWQRQAAGTLRRDRHGSPSRAALEQPRQARKVCIGEVGVCAGALLHGFRRGSSRRRWHWPAPRSRTPQLLLSLRQPWRVVLKRIKAWLGDNMPRPVPIKAACAPGDRSPGAVPAASQAPAAAQRPWTAAARRRRRRRHAAPSQSRDDHEGRRRW